jgi:hypothetical protein
MRLVDLVFLFTTKNTEGREEKQRKQNSVSSLFSVVNLEIFTTYLDLRPT